MLVNIVLPQEEGQVLVEGDVLDDGDVDVPGFLVESLVTPVGVDTAQLLGYQVMVPGRKCQNMFGNQVGDLIQQCDLTVL